MYDFLLKGYYEGLTCILDINSELDELDREEFYRLKKACRALLSNQIC